MSLSELHDRIAAEQDAKHKAALAKIATWRDDEIAAFDSIGADQIDAAFAKARERETACAELYQQFKRTHRPPRIVNRFDDRVGAPDFARNEEILWETAKAARAILSAAYRRRYDLQHGIETSAVADADANADANADAGAEHAG